jgi:YegS/Rv2252/BmrU family lipid kinase
VETATTAAAADQVPTRYRTLDVRALEPPPVLVFNPNAGQKLGLSTNSGSADAVQTALTGAGVPFVARPTERAGHATELAREAVVAGCRLVIAAGGDGTVGEVAQALVGTPTVLGVMPLGSIMNVARTLCLPRDLPEAAEVIRGGRVLLMDVGRAEDTYFLEAAGVGLDAGLFAYFNRVDSGTRPLGAVRALFRFLRGLGTPRLLIEADGRRFEIRSPLVTVANSPFVGAAFAVAPEARIDDGLLDVVVYRGAGVLRVLFHLLTVAGGRRLPPPARAEAFRVHSIHVVTRRRRPLPVHADGDPIGATPVRFDVVPAALQVLVGMPEEGGECAWAPWE